MLSNSCQGTSSTELKKWLVVLSGGLFFFFEYFQINMFNVIDYYLMEEFHIDGYTIGLLGSIYFYGTILFLIPAGILIDKISIRGIILLSSSLSVIATVLFGLAQSVEQLILSRLLVGLCAGPFALISAIKLVSRWGKRDEIDFMISLIISLGMIAGIVSQAPFAALINYMGWRGAIWVDAAFGLLIVCFIFAFMDNYPDTYEAQRDKINYLAKEILFKVTKRKVSWLVGLFASLLNLPLFLLGSMAGVLYLGQVYSMDVMESSKITSMLYWGMLLGCPIFGWIASHTQKRMFCLYAGASIYLFSILAIILYSNFSLWQLYILFLFIGFGSSAQTVAFSLIEKINDKQHVGIAEGLHSVLIMAGGAVFQPMLGLFLDKLWDGKLANGVRVFSTQAFQKSFMMMPISILTIMAVTVLYLSRKNRMKLLPITN